MEKRTQEFLDRVGGCVEEWAKDEVPETVGVWDETRQTTVYADACIFDEEEGIYVPLMETDSGLVRCDYDEATGTWIPRERA